MRRTRSRRRRSHHLRGYVAADAIMALAIVLMLIGVLTVAVSRQRRGSERLAESRAAVRLAETTLIAMQTGAQSPAAPEGFAVNVRPSDAPGGLQLPAGCAWVDVRVTVQGRSSTTLSGLVRADAAKGAAQ